MAVKKDNGKFIGKSHAEGGIPSKVKETGQLIEIEGDEWYVCNEAYNSDKRYSFKNKTNEEVLEKIYRDHSCKLNQSLMSAGDFIVCKVVVRDKKKYDREGTVSDIVNEMQGEKSCKVENGGDYLKRGGEINARQKKIATVMREFKEGTLKTSYGEKVTDEDQAIAIALSEADRMKKENGGSVLTYKHKYNEKYGYRKNKAHSLEDISKETGVSLEGLQQIYNKGIGAFKTNPESVRPNVKSKEQWAMARVYSAVMGGEASKVDSKELKMFKGGQVDEYNKWKNIDWDSFKIEPKKRSNIYRLFMWNKADRIDWDKVPAKDKEWFQEDVIDELESEVTLDYIFSDRIDEVENQFDVLMQEDSAESDEGIEKLLKGDYKDLKSQLDNLGITWKDLETKSKSEIKKKVYDDKDLDWVIDYLLLNDENYLELDYMLSHTADSPTEKLEFLYQKLLDNGAVFTEEAEEQQYDLFNEVQTAKEGSLIEELDIEIESLEELLEEASEEKDLLLVDELEGRIEFLKELREEEIGEEPKPEPKPEPKEEPKDEINTPQKLGKTLKNIFKDKYGITIKTRYIKTVRGLDGSPYEISTFKTKEPIPNNLRKRFVELTYNKPIEELNVRNESDINYGNTNEFRVSMSGSKWKEWIKEISGSKKEASKSETKPEPKEEPKSDINVAGEILNQLGGHRFLVMTGARNLVSDTKNNALMFKIGRNKSKANYVKIRLNSMDTYDMLFARIHGAKYTELKEYEGLYGDQLQTVFTDYTGLYTRLEKGGKVMNTTFETPNGIGYEEYIESVNGATIILYPEENHSKEDVSEAKKWLKDNLDVVSIRIADNWDLDNAYKKDIFRDPRTKKLKWYQIEQDEKLIRKERKKGTTPEEFVTKIVLPNVKKTESEMKKKYGKSIYEMKKGGEIKGDFIVYSEDENGRSKFISDHATYRGATMKMNKLWKTGDYDRLGTTNKKDWEMFHAPYALEKGGVTSNGLHTVEVIFENPKYNYSTAVSPNSTEDSARKYFVGKKFNVGTYPKEQMEEVVDIKFTPNPNTMEKGGRTKIELVHVYDKDGSMYGTGQIEEVKGDKTLVRFDGSTVREFDSSQVVPVMEKGGGIELFEVDFDKDGQLGTYLLRADNIRDAQNKFLNLEENKGKKIIEIRSSLDSSKSEKFEKGGSTYSGGGSVKSSKYCNYYEGGLSFLNW